MNDLEKAISILKSNDYTLVAVKGDDIITFKSRGVKPLLELIDAAQDYHDYSFADKVIGRASAFLYLIIGASKIYSTIISEGALKLLKDLDIEYEVLTEYIINRNGDGMCPMEEATLNIDTKEMALLAIRKRLAELNNK